MHIIIAEKNLAGERIAQILGGKTVRLQTKGFAKYYSFTRNGQENIVLPLRGHIVEVDFPKQYGYWRGTDLKQLVSAPILYLPSDPAIASLLREMGTLAKKVIIATDADREGESIGVEALRILQETNSHVGVERAYFSAMTPKELVKSFDELVKVDYNLSDSADSRREIDLVWGAVLTRYVSIMANRMGKEFISVGRVQTPVLALIVNREKERIAFVVQPYWEIIAHCEKEKQKFEAFHKGGKIFDEAKALEIFEKVKDAKNGKVIKVVTRKKSIPRPVPFNTTQLLRSASALGMTAGQAMNIAESLYMAGYISYPRTDNTVYPSALNLVELLQELATFPEYKKFVDEILSKPLNSSRGDKNTTDHPPVHPTKVPDKSRMQEKEWKLFDLVARRFLATFLPDAQTENVSVDIDIHKEPFVATGQTILSLGWKAAYPFSTLQEIVLPKLKEGEMVDVNKMEMPRKETQPPSRYSQSALLKIMEELGLGTKCLHGGTLVKVFNSNNAKSISMKNLFDGAKKTGLIHDSAEIRENNSFDCIGVSLNGETKKETFPLISRRPTDPKVDKMKKIRFTDGSSIEATNNHPILCYLDGDLSFLPVSELKFGTRTVAYHHQEGVPSENTIEWKDFVSLCDEKTPIYAHGVSEDVYSFREKEALTQRAFAGKYGGHQSNFVAYEKGTRPVPVGIFKSTGIIPQKISGINHDSIIQNPFPLTTSKPLVRILAKIIGDGSLDRAKVIEENCYDFRYTNTNPELLVEFADDVTRVFNVKTTLFMSPPAKEWHHAKAAVRMPGVVGRILAMLFPDILVKRPWKRLPAALYADFIGSFFDDEGHVVKKETKLFISGTNHETLKDIQKMLLHLQVVSRLDEKQHKLYVSQRQSLFNFLEKIPITSTYKKKRLIEMLSNNYRYAGMKQPFFLFEKELLKTFLLPRSTEEVAKALNVSKTAIRTRIRRLLRDKKVKKIVNRNNKDIPRIIKYVSLVDLTKSGHVLLGETAIGPNLVTKTVERVEDAPLPEFVYDITNSEERPAFVLGNNLIVHNSTRHEIIQKLFARKYISGIKSIEPNQIAFAVIDSLEKHCKIVTEPKMTAELEHEMDGVANGKKEKVVVVDDSRKMLLGVLDQLLVNKSAISFELKKALVHQDVLATCPLDGGNLIVRKAGATGKRFLGCSNYPNCKTTYSLPQKGSLYPLNKNCPTCNTPMIKLSGTRFKMDICLNYDCPSKDAWKKTQAEKAAAASASFAGNNVLPFPPTQTPSTPSTPSAPTKKKPIVRKRKAV